MLDGDLADLIEVVATAKDLARQVYDCTTSGFPRETLLYTVLTGEGANFA